LLGLITGHSRLIMMEQKRKFGEGNLPAKDMTERDTALTPEAERAQLEEQLRQIQTAAARGEVPSAESVRTVTDRLKILRGNKE